MVSWSMAVVTAKLMFDPLAPGPPSWPGDPVVPVPPPPPCCGAVSPYQLHTAAAPLDPAEPRLPSVPLKPFVPGAPDASILGMVHLQSWDKFTQGRYMIENAIRERTSDTALDRDAVDPSVALDANCSTFPDANMPGPQQRDVSSKY